jgi:hypothetical protein
MKNWRLWLGLLVSAFFIWVALRQVKDWQAFFNSFRQVRLWVLVPTFVSYAVVMLTRAWRWDYIMKSQVKVKFSSSLIGLIIGYMANNILPLRAGELFRAVVVSRREKQGFSPIFASVVVERIFDSLAILVFLAVVLLALPFPEQYADWKTRLRATGMFALFFALGLMVFLYLLYFYQEPLLKLADLLLKPFGRKLRELGVRELSKFSSGLVILGKPSRMSVVMLQSFLVWLVNLVPIWFVGLGFGARFSFMGVLFLLCIGGFSAAIPAAPGFWGTFHYITSKGVLFLGTLGPEKALSLAIILHAFYYFPTLLVGLALLWREGYSLFEIERQAEKADSEQARSK